RSWSTQFDYFSDNYRNLFVDLRGYGSSSKLPPGIENITQLYCNDIMDLMEHLDITCAAIAIIKLVVLNGSPKFKRNTTGYPFSFSDIPIQDHFLAQLIREVSKTLADAVLDPAVIFQDLNATDAEKVASWFRVMCYNAALDTLLGFFKYIVNDDYRPLGPLIPALTLILSSSLGKEVPAQAALYMRQHFQNSKLVEFSDADHFFHITRPVVVSRLIGAFLATEPL
ncbi:hypothetical protein DPV78_011171, partial [Talaromyces pinophilus]